ncbi:low molecular weight protein-tyrosine-phosphatase [Novosphingobium sp. KACC 22771]|uniref:low molecular weight protein-tyrosine-phosphatase n=1 Tax=Novosphingobium sp. KACC 22771 TaxID=3025670 RepID=UPI002365F8FE|nr:low molecular weight protein-tyrosine-phosphatase [Novosphingobium sp. KACC 22771]WDF71947.1 low molecular weight phosphotyrosine protein phosphatase [Novosphingobium sp. KACC 22771]
MVSEASVLFVCLGNICRSPLAEGAFRAAASRAGLAVHVDSAGTGGWHIGEAPDPRARAEAARHGVDITRLRARQVESADFRHFSHIIALDEANLADLRRLAPADASARIALLLDHLPGREGQSVADPYYGGTEDFAAAWREIAAAAEALVRHLHGAS